MVTYWDMDGVLANFHKAFAENRGVALSRFGMANLEPFAENVAILRARIAAGEKCYILTRAANDNGAAGKIDWLRKYVPEMDAENIIILLKGRKVDNIREPGILIDDDERNTKAWNKAGFPAILLAEKGETVRL